MNTVLIMAIGIIAILVIVFWKRGEMSTLEASNAYLEAKLLRKEQDVMLKEKTITLNLEYMAALNARIDFYKKQAAAYKGLWKSAQECTIDIPEDPKKESDNEHHQAV